jgi:hypothetical protein
MDISSIVKVMVANGASIELVSAVVEEVERQRNASLEIIREKKRLQKRKERLMSRDVAATGGDNERQVATGSDLSPPLMVSPPSLYSNISTPPSLNPPSLNSSFAEFWLAYPRKVGKGTALKAYAKALKKTQPETILAAVKAYPWPADKEFVPHPSTWLNGERWADETQPTGEPKTKTYWDMTAEERAEYDAEHQRKLDMM